MNKYSQYVHQFSKNMTISFMRYTSLQSFKGSCFFIFLFTFIIYLFITGILYDIPKQPDTGEYTRRTKLNIKPFKLDKRVNVTSYKVGIIMVVTADSDLSYYEDAIQSVQCYSQIQKYQFILAVDNEYNCTHTDKFFRRHCVAAKILPLFDTILFLDADIGLVNPKKRIEEYMDDHIDVTFYDRFYNWEIMAGSYIARNTPYSVDLLNEFADYEYKIPASFHGTDNGALHLFLAEKVFPNESAQLNICRQVYNMSNGFDDLFTYEACIRGIFGASTDFGKLRIMKKGTGWARDEWLTSGQWHPDIDFMFHGWKRNQLRETPENLMKPDQMDRGIWYNPLIGSIDLSKCNPSNTTWNYDKRLMGNKQDILDSLKQFEEKVAFDQIMSYARIPQVLSRWF